MPKVSVVIPVYNASAYIERCTRTLFGQTLNDIEYIFVNDCTQDNSIEKLLNILEEYPQRKNRVKIINHQINTGVGQARIDGISEATGDYVIHCDSDDYIDLDFYEKLYCKAIESGADVICANCDIINNTDGTQGSLRFTEHADVHKFIINNGAYLHALWNKLYKRSIAQASTVILPADLCMGEDWLRNLAMLKLCKTIAYCPDARYKYVQHANSLMRMECGKKKLKDQIRLHILIQKTYPKIIQSRYFIHSRETAVFYAVRGKCISKQEYYTLLKSRVPMTFFRWKCEIILRLKKVISLLLNKRTYEFLQHHWRKLRYRKES